MLSYRIRDRTARWKAIAACTVTWQVQSAAYQKLTAKKKSFVKPGRPTNRLRSRPSSTPSPTSTALLVFLWPQPPPLEGAQRPTDLRLSVVHAFISDHTRRFRPEIREDENACGCDRFFTNITYRCPRHVQARRRASHRYRDRWQYSPDCFSTRAARKFISFLPYSRATLSGLQHGRFIWDDHITLDPSLTRPTGYT